MLSLRIGQKRNNLAVAQGTVLGPYGAADNGQGKRPSCLEVQIKRQGASAHSVTVEGANDRTGPWKILATLADENITKVTEVPDYVRFNVGTSTGGTVDVLCTPGIN